MFEVQYYYYNNDELKTKLFENYEEARKFLDFMRSLPTVRDVIVL